MPKWIQPVLGGLEIAAGVLTLNPVLIDGGAGTLISGLGTLLSKQPIKGFQTTERNSIAPWKTVYGRARVGGTIVYVNLWPQPGNNAGGNDQMLDMVIVLAAHQIESVDAVLFDMAHVAIDNTSRINTHQSGTGSMNAGANPNSPYTGLGAGVSYTPVQQSVGPGTGGIPSIQRRNDVVTVTLHANIPSLIPGDKIQIADDGSTPLTSNNLVGTFPVAQILSQVVGSPGSIIFTYLSGGADCGPFNGYGQVNTLWADYGRTVYYEAMLGGQSLGQSFQGMIFGTPLDGDMGDIVSPSHTGGVQGQDQPNPWTSNCSLVGKAAVFLRLHYNATYYKGGIPQISFLVHGKNDILDPRPSPMTTGYSENAVLCIADYLATPRTAGGFGAAYGTEIPYSYLSAAANTCDEAVPLAESLSSPPVTEPLWTCNGQFDLSMRRGEILQNMLTSCSGRLTFYGGQYIIWPAAWTGNQIAIGSNPGGGVLSLPTIESMAAGGVKWHPTTPGRELFNGVKGTYISQYDHYQSTDFPPYCQDELHGYSDGSSLYEYDANLTFDGGDRRWKEVQLPFTISSRQAQQSAKIELLRGRNHGGNPRGSGLLTLNMIGYQIATLDLMTIVYDYLNWNEKQFEVAECRIELKQVGDNKALTPVVEVDFVEIDSETYDWDTTEELSPQGYQQPVIPGIGSFLFFATETVPGYDVPFPWKPAGITPFVGDAMFPTPVSGSPLVSEALATFGLQTQYTTDNQGSPVVVMDVSGVLPPNALSSIAPPQVTCVVGTSGSLPPGKYIVAASALDTATPAHNSVLSTPFVITIPSPSPTANTGSIAVTVQWPYGANGGEIYLASLETEEGYFYQGSLTSSETTFTITEFDQSTPGAPDGTFDHLAVAWKKVIHGGPFAVQIQNVTSNTITIGGAGMTTNQWAGRICSLLGKLDSTQPFPVLNMPVSASTASTGLSPGSSVSATIVGTMTGNPSNGQTAIIAGVTYTFQTTLTNVAGNVQIGSSESQSMRNLIAAIEAGAGAGTSYAAATLPNPEVVAVQTGFIPFHFTCTAIVAGPAGNSLTASGTAPISWSNGGSFSGGASPDEFTLTIGPNSNGNQLPDLTTLLVPGDLVLMRFNPTFTLAGFSDALIANPFYPQGATGVEPGHLVIVLTGPDAGDVQTISAVNQDGSGNYTEFVLAAPWATIPNDGDIIIIVESAWGPEYHTGALSAASRGVASGVVASPVVTNLTNQTWLFIVRAQTSQDDNGADQFAPIREIFIFGSQGTRTIYSSTTMLPTDQTILVDASAGPVVFTLLPFFEIPNQKLYIQKIDSTSNTVTVVVSGSPSGDTINGATSVVLTAKDQPLFMVIPGNG